MLLNSMTNSWFKQAYVQGFYSKYISFKKINMFERINISESIYEVVVEPSYKNYTRADANRAGHSRPI